MQWNKAIDSPLAVLISERTHASWRMQMCEGKKRVRIDENAICINLHYQKLIVQNQYFFRCEKNNQSTSVASSMILYWKSQCEIWINARINLNDAKYVSGNRFDKNFNLELTTESRGKLQITERLQQKKEQNLQNLSNFVGN